MKENKDILLKLLDNKEVKEYPEDFIINFYCTLLSLNNNTYNPNNLLNEINLTEDFLRKINNLKIKIQLHRKEEEIDKFLDNIKTIYDSNSTIINKYNYKYIFQ